MIITIIVAIIIFSLMNLLGFQRNLTLRKELQVHAYNAAESAADAAYSYVINDIETNSLTGAASVPTSGSLEFTFPAGSEEFFKGTVPSTTSFSTTPGPISLTGATVRVGAPETQKNGAWFVNGKDPAYSNDPNRNQWVYESTVPVCAKVSAESGKQEQTAYVEKDIALRRVPLFQHAIFFQGQLHLHRGYRPMGSIHTNGNLLLNAHDDDTALYNGRMSAGARFYRGSTFDAGGTGVDGYAYCPVNSKGELDFTYSNLKPVATGGSGQIKILIGGSNAPDPYATVPNNFDSRMTDWKTKASERFNGNLEDVSHSVPQITPTGADGYLQDVKSTTGKNEFTNGPYALIEPVLPDTHPGYKPGNIYNLEAQASLILSIEACDNFMSKLKDANGNTVATAAEAANLADLFIVRAYRGTAKLPDQRVMLPTAAIGIARYDPDLSKHFAKDQNGQYKYISVTPGATPADYRLEKYKYNTSTSKVDTGLHDARLGRGVQPLTIDLEELKHVMEANPNTLTGNDKIFRLGDSDGKYGFKIRNVDAGYLQNEWNGIIYVEFPTSLEPDLSRKNDLGGVVSYQFRLAKNVELLHPDRSGPLDTEGRKNREDKIVPIAPELRQYPTDYSDATLQNPRYAIPAVQLVNGSKLPNIPASTIKDSKGKYTPLGFTIATNGAVYTVGNYNADGNYLTGTNITSNQPGTYATADSEDEIPAAIFCDTYTVLSNEWGKYITVGSIKGVNREKSFIGTANASINNRPVINYVEISACIATGEYPIFEFFIHALENYKSLYDKMSTTKANPIIFKGSVVGMFHSEIQHIKQAYGRDTGTVIEHYYHAHGAFAIAAVRFHQFLALGQFPPGTPMAYSYRTTNFKILRTGNSDDLKDLQKYGMVP
ncbi:hypothetical protein DB347_19080 [Opitutaceae bacterium EW11]|nr:hypothetical protein DB347_19080 [Opitutaceae bacterium EW11]